MAKKDPTDLSVEERLKTLYQLQTALSSIDEKRALRGELPLEVQDLEDEIEGLEFPDTDIETLNGFLLYKLGGFPKDEGNIKIDYGGFSFESLEIEDKLIKSVKITKDINI